jgi:pyruvate dehydrogenase E2 component (dihydrolipoamide acetyltransferase)
MATKVHMEALSPTMEEGQVVRWLKSEGDEVSNGDILAEIETDKATMELSARGAGVLRKILVEEGGVAAVGDVIAVIAGADEDIEELTGADAPDSAEAPKSKSDKDSEPSAAESDQDEVEDETGTQDSSKSQSDKESEVPEAAGRVKASPVARRLAEEAGVDLASLEGSGPGGRIVKKDVEAARSSESPPGRAPGRAEEPKRTPAPEAWADAGAEEAYEDLAVSQMRKAIARRLGESLGPVPHFFLTVDIDMGRVMEARTRLNGVIERDGDKLSVNDFVLKATAAALRRHPDCNAAWHTDHIRRYAHVHIGVAVAVEDGLITPVVKHADRKGLVQISREVKEMAGRAHDKKLKPEEYTGSTFSVSNLGMFGIHEFTAIINPPEAGILAVGAIEDTPVVIDGEVVVRPRMRITMSCDHRVIDGAQGSRFLQTLRAMLEEPAAALL